MTTMEEATAPTVRHCHCGARIGPLDQWCSRRCFEEDEGFDRGDD